MSRRASRIVFVGTLALALGVLGYAVNRRARAVSRATGSPASSVRAAAVEVAPIERGEIVSRRTFSGTLEATSEFQVAAKVAGRIARIEVDLGDPVRRGQLLLQLEDAEYVQAVHQAEAELEVARATASEAQSLLEIASRGLERAASLQERGVSSEAQLDGARAEELARRAALAVARARTSRAEAALETERIRLAYTRVSASWSGAEGQHLVAERMVDEGETVAANRGLLTVVELDPITAVFHVPERDYARLTAGQSATLSTQALPEETFEGTIARIAPVFRASTRQARVELRVANPDGRLKPGMFARITVELERVADATRVPIEALTQRGDQTGIFVLSADRERVHWRPVRVGIREDGRVQVEGDELAGSVVTLGQRLVDEGSSVWVVTESRP